MSGPVDPVTESAKAIQEVAKATGKAIDASRGVGGFLDRIFGKAVEDTVGRHWTDRIAADRIAAAIYSWERLELLLHKTEQRLKAAGVQTTRFLPPKVALPLIEHATMEDDDDLHTLWANLLATALDSTANPVHKKMVSALGELTAEDALVLTDMWGFWKKEDKKKLEPSGTGLRYGPSVDGTGSYNEVSVITLNRVGLIQPAYTEIQTYEPPGNDRRGDWGPYREPVLVFGDLTTVMVTEFGEVFCAAVIEPA